MLRQRNTKADEPEKKYPLKWPFTGGLKSFSRSPPPIPVSPINAKGTDGREGVPVISDMSYCMQMR